MQTATQVKATASATQTTVGKARQPANAAPVNEREAPTNDGQPENATRLGHSLGAINVLPPDPPIQLKRAPGVISRLTGFNASSPGNAPAISGLPASWTVRLPIQAKLTVGQPNDQYEQEADRVADQVMRMAEPRVQAKCACGGEAGPDGECAACKARRLEAQAQVQTKPDEEAVVQTKADAEPTEAAPDLESRLNSSRGSGSTLPDETRSSMESAFGVDFGVVRVHTGNDAVQMNRDLSAQAFTHGSDIYFNAGKYDPGSVAGKGLLAHELTHVVQQNVKSLQKSKVNQTKNYEGENYTITDLTNIRQIRSQTIGEATAIQRNPDPFDPDAPFTLPQIEGTPRLYVTLNGFYINVDTRTRFAKGEKIHQAIAVILYAIVGNSYSKDLVIEVLKSIKVKDPGASPYPAFTGAAKEGELFPDFRLDLKFASWIIEYLDSKQISHTMTDEQREILDLGGAIEWLLNEYKSQKVQQEVGVTFPAWYPLERIGRADLANFGTLLRDFARAKRAFVADQQNNDKRQMVINTMRTLLIAIAGPALVLEEIRKDANLANHPSYRLLWPPSGGSTVVPKVGESIPQSSGGALTPGQIAPETQLPQSPFGNAFMNFARTQSTLTAKVSDPTEGPAARKQLLDYFIEWAPSAFAVTPSDTKILNSPALANMKPHPAKLSVTPGISPPLFDAAIEADYHFWMQLDFPTVFDAMTNYIYQWERIKIPEETIKAGADISKARGKKPTWGEVASLRYKRTGRYAYEDIMRTIGTYSNLIGPPGSEVSLVSLNAAFRLLGTTFSLGIDELTTPRSEKKVPFPDGEGLYIVTCRASQSQRGQGFIRAQSVAWLPVFARAAGQMAEIRLAATITNREEAKKRLAEIQKLLKNKNAPDREALIAEGEALYKTLQSYPESLSQQISVLRERRSQVEKRISEIESGASLNEGEFLFELKNELKRLNNQLEPLEKIEGTRKGRSTAEHDLSQAEQLTAVFVSDLGQTMYLALESVPMNKGTDAFHYYVSDTTTPKSGEADAEGDTKDKAILEAVMKILEGSKGYGRGQISIEIGNNRYNRRVAASEGALLLEAAENMATALSVAAVAAAPFTGGASLYILLPVGVIGAIPSAYRIITSVKDQTFHLDLEFAMDVVNIIGSFVGLGEAAVPLKFLRIGKALLIIGAGTNGLGVLLMGAQIMEQLTNLGDLPPGMKLARILSVVGSAMVQAGIMVGQVLAERAKVKEMERAVSLSEGKQLDAHRQAAFESWESGLSPETKTELAADPSLREFFREMDPRVRRALTLCESLCIPTKPRPSANDIFRIQQLLDRFNVQPDHPGLREYLHRRKFDIGAAIDELWPAKNLTEAKRIFDRSISSLAEGGTAQKVRGKWKFTRNDGKIVTEHTLGEHGKLTTELQSVGFFESHHGIQDVWAKEVGLEVVGYSRDTCYAILLRDSHAGSPHQRITSRQKGREAGRNKRTYEQERQNLRSDMIASDVPQAISDELLAKSDAYFGKLYNALETKMRASGAKTNEINAKMKEIFGSWYPDHP